MHTKQTTPKKCRLTVIVLSIIIFLTITEISYLWLAKNHYVGSLSRYKKISADTFRLKSSKTDFGYNSKYTEMFLAKIDTSKKSRSKDKSIQNAIGIREYILDLSGEKGDLITGGPINLLQGISTGKTLFCAELANLYGFLLDSLGYTVRYICISRSIFDEWDTHASIEIYDENLKKWILTDPTFNVSFKYDGTYLSSDELYDIIHTGKAAFIEVVRGEKTKYT